MDKKEYLTEGEILKLNEDQKKLYEFAMCHINDEWACGSYGGWSRAYDALLKIGYTKEERREGHRCYISLKKPVINND
jgi:hypothetical protein